MHEPSEHQSDDFRSDLRFRNTVRGQRIEFDCGRFHARVEFVEQLAAGGFAVGNRAFAPQIEFRHALDEKRLRARRAYEPLVYFQSKK